MAVEHRRDPRDRQRRGRHREDEAAGRAVLEPAELLDLPAHQPGLVALGRRLPARVGQVGVGRDVALHGGALEAVGAGEAVPVEVGPPGRVDEVVGLGDRLGPHAGDEADHARHDAGMSVDQNPPQVGDDFSLDLELSAFSQRRFQL